MTAGPANSIRLIIDNVEINARGGQTIAGALLSADQRSWRISARDRRPRGLFCGIGVCFDCLITVNGVRDVRACQRVAADGDVIDIQSEPLPDQEAP